MQLLSYILPFNFSVCIFLCRIRLAVLHFNENSGREQATTVAGKLQYSVVFPKHKKGGYIVKKVTKDATYGKQSHLAYMSILFLVPESLIYFVPRLH